MSNGLGAVGGQAATRDNGAIRSKACHVQELVGKTRGLVAKCEQFRHRVTGLYEEAVVKSNTPEQSQEHRTDIDELQHQLHNLEGALDTLETHLCEIDNL